MGVCDVGLALHGKDRHDDEPQQAQQRDRDDRPRPKAHPADTRQMMFGHDLILSVYRHESYPA